MTEALATVRGLTITFAGAPVSAVAGVSFDVRAGECVALVGESGSGKSLTAKALLGLAPPTATVTAETLLVPGGAHQVAAPPGRSRAWQPLRGRTSALVPQDALGALDPLRRVEHEVGDPLRLHRLAPRRERRARVLAALGEAGMPDAEHRLTQRPDELSGGMKQRALIAAALISHPRLLIADEPTTALDAGYRRRVLELFRTRISQGAGVLLISHDLASVRHIADRVLVMQAGEIVEQGPTEQVLATPTHSFTRRLLTAAPRPRMPSPERRASPAQGDPPRLELRDVSLSYGSHQVLREISLRIHPGETVGLAGWSGQGKTSLLRVALGLVRADQGTVLIDGVDRQNAPRLERRALRRRIALVPQDPLDFFPRGRSGQAILHDALRAAGVPLAARAPRTVALAAEVDLAPELLTRPTSTLSGGQRQRLAIARALAQDPAILLLDEPVSALDLTVQARVLDVLAHLQHARNMAMLFVSHDEAVLAQVSDRIVRLHEGSLTEH